MYHYSQRCPSCQRLSNDRVCQGCFVGTHNLSDKERTDMQNKENAAKIAITQSTMYSRQREREQSERTIAAGKAFRDGVSKSTNELCTRCCNNCKRCCDNTNAGC